VHTIRREPENVHDLLGIGFEPSHPALALAIEEYNGPVPTGEQC
jgi:lysine/ornithine N-monooxygenase